MTMLAKIFQPPMYGTIYSSHTDPTAYRHYQMQSSFPYTFFISLNPRFVCSQYQCSESRYTPVSDQSYLTQWHDTKPNERNRLSTLDLLDINYYFLVITCPSSLLKLHVVQFVIAISTSILSLRTVSALFEQKMLLTRKAPPAIQVQSNFLDFNDRKNLNITSFCVLLLTYLVPNHQPCNKS